MSVMHQLTGRKIGTAACGPLVRQVSGEPLQLGRNGRVEVVA